MFHRTRQWYCRTLRNHSKQLCNQRLCQVMSEQHFPRFDFKIRLDGYPIWRKVYYTLILRESYKYTKAVIIMIGPLQWLHDERDCVSNHRYLGCLLNRLFRRKSEKKIQATCHWHLWGEFTGERWIYPHKGQVILKMFPLNDVIIQYEIWSMRFGSRFSSWIMMKGHRLKIFLWSNF